MPAAQEAAARGGDAAAAAADTVGPDGLLDVLGELLARGGGPDGGAAMGMSADEAGCVLVAIQHSAHSNPRLASGLLRVLLRLLASGSAAAAAARALERAGGAALLLAPAGSAHEGVRALSLHLMAALLLGGGEASPGRSQVRASLWPAAPAKRGPNPYHFSP
jgi:hypothetical protein